MYNLNVEFFRIIRITGIRSEELACYMISTCVEPGSQVHSDCLFMFFIEFVVLFSYDKFLLQILMSRRVSVENVSTFSYV